MVLQIYIQGKERGYWKQVNTFCKNIGFICCFDVVDILVCLCFMSGKGIRICSLEKKDEITLLQRILKFPLTINRISNISIVFAQFHLKKNRIRYSFSYTFTSAAKNQQPFTTTACSGKDHTHHKHSCIRHTLAPNRACLLGMALGSELPSTCI